MSMPRKFKGFINDREWGHLGLDKLRPAFRNSIIEAMAAGFDALDQREPDDKSIQHILDLAQADADNMREISRLNLLDISDSEMASGFAMGDFLLERDAFEEEEVAREMEEEEKNRKQEQQPEEEKNRLPHLRLRR